jgi:cytochrome c2
MTWLLLSAPFIAWHLPGPYEWMCGSNTARVLAFASFFLGALAFWTAVMTRARKGRVGSALLLVAAAGATTSLPGALLSFAPRVVYRGLPDPFPVCGLSAIEDQQLAGLIMWIPMDAIMLAAAAWLFIAWLREAERRVSFNVRHASAAMSLLLLIPLLAGCGEGPDAAAAPATDGDARRGAKLMERYGCGACHIVPGLADAQGLVGPPLTKMGRRVYIAGVLRNSPDNMMTWLQDPQRIHPGNAMPNMGIGPDDARDLTAYLFTLR